MGKEYVFVYKARISIPTVHCNGPFHQLFFEVCDLLIAYFFWFFLIISVGIHPQEKQGIKLKSGMCQSLKIWGGMK